MQRNNISGRLAERATRKNEKKKGTHVASRKMVERDPER
jgi:hypothetical protein